MKLMLSMVYKKEKRNKMKAYIKTIIILFGVFVAAAFVQSCDDDGIGMTVETDPQKNNRSMRLISYNILEGMKGDKANNYDNFVAWLQEYNPDVLALQEANGFTQESLEALAIRYGHSYVLTNVKIGDNYPVAITSKYPIEKRRRLTKHVSHGAIFATINGINFVNLHLWPQAYWHEKDDGLGTEYRMQEMKIFLDSTYYKYPNENKWLLMGDFNSKARIDAVDMTSPQNEDFRVHDMIADADFYDTVRALLDPDEYVGSRIDFVYASPAMLVDVTKAHFIRDEFTKNKEHSDHYPMLVEFRY